MKSTIIAMTAVAVVLLAAAFNFGGAQLVAEGVISGVEMLIPIIPILLAAFFAAGLITELISKDLVYRWLGEGAGWKGPLLGTLAGALVPGGPFFFYPLIATLYASGASGGTVFSFVAAKTLWSVGRIPLEIAFVGMELTLIRLSVTFFLPMLVGLLVNALFRRFSERIRGDVQRIQHSRGDQK